MFSFEERARQVHGNKYDYSKVKYVNLLTKVEIICPDHGSFWQVPKSHLAGHGCPHKDCVRKKLEATNMARYGVARPLQSKEVHDRVVETNMRVYGVPNPSMTQAVTDKRIATCREKYGVDYSLQAPEVIEKSKATNMERRGVPYSVQSPEVIAKTYRSKCINGTFNNSKLEDRLDQLLVEMFGDDDVFRNYNEDSRYPFAVDFYIGEMDCFIELNVHWTHGNHFFNKENDAFTLAMWQEKAKTSDFYRSAIYVWTESDVRKRETARLNNLNYLTFWDSKLRDFEMWRKAGCPDSHDWECEYQWFYEREGIK